MRQSSWLCPISPGLGLLQASSKDSNNYPHLRTTILGHLSYSIGQEIETHRE